MDIPGRLELEILSNEPTPPYGLIIGMRVAAGTKNPYHIYFPKTDTNGRTTLERAGIVGQFKDHWEEGLMDYNGTLEAAPQTATFFLFSTRELRANMQNVLAWPLLAYEKTVWQSRAQRVNYFLSSCNSRYRLSEATMLVPTNGVLQLQVRRRHGPFRIFGTHHEA